MIEANRTVGAAPRPRPTRRWVWIAAALLVLVVAAAGVLVGQVVVPVTDLTRAIFARLGSRTA